MIHSTLRGNGAASTIASAGTRTDKAPTSPLLRTLVTGERQVAVNRLYNPKTAGSDLNLLPQKT